jgi:hypothetical protein
MALSAFALNQSRLRANNCLGFSSRAWCQFIYCPIRTRASRDTSPRLATQPRIMQHEQSTSGQGADAQTTTIEQRKAGQMRTAVSALELRITKQILAANAALLAQLQPPTTTPAITSQLQSIPADTTPTTEGGKEALAPPIDVLDDDPEPTESVRARRLRLLRRSHSCRSRTPTARCT